MSVLKEICDKKREHVAIQKTKTPLDALKSQLKDAPPPKGFINTLANADGPALIAEVKKASPSKGIIRKDFDPVTIAQAYESGGASCLSVLTDSPYFQGSDAYFKDVRRAVDLPLLRKDFMVDPYQIYESRVMGADCILIIMAALNDSQALELYKLAVDLGMDALIETHNEEELNRALTMNPEMIGVNNRNLKTLNVDIQTSFALAPQMPDTVLKVAESGIGDAETIHSLHDQGYKAFLVGESLMRQENIKAATQALLTQKAN